MARQKKQCADNSDIAVKVTDYKTVATDETVIKDTL